MDSKRLTGNIQRKMWMDRGWQSEPDLVVFSHLRWDFVFQRPQHLMSRFARTRRVFFVEEPVVSRLGFPTLHVSERENGLKVVVPQLPQDVKPGESDRILRMLINELLLEEALEEFTAWYYTPMALPWTRHLSPGLVVYDCMDELSAFRNAPMNLASLERELVRRSDLMFTGGLSLFESKRILHRNIHAFPSSIDFSHFSRARRIAEEPPDQAVLKGPRIGFFGVIDERLDTSLVAEMAALRPEWNFIFIGPIAKIDPELLPRAANLHYLGSRPYEKLPDYLAGWDVAMLPFARNESTRFISPTKTPEYLSGGRPVVSTEIRDVVRPYGELKLVRIANSAGDFVRAAESAIQDALDPDWLRRVDDFLGRGSWEKTCDRMLALEKETRESARVSSERELET